LLIIFTSRATAKYRAPQYNRTFFILPPSGAPNLKLDTKLDFQYKEHKVNHVNTADSEMESDTSHKASDSDMVSGANFVWNKVLPSSLESISTSSEDINTKTAHRMHDKNSKSIILSYQQAALQ
jgi:hypothetical protein